MGVSEDVRWKQRFSNYRKALRELKEAVELSQTRELSKLEKQGVIQGFECTHELAWNCLKDYLEHQGPADVKGSRDATREAFKRGLIADGHVWMDMIRGRNLTSHTYNNKSAEALHEAIVNRYFPQFVVLESEFLRLEAHDDA